MNEINTAVLIIGKIVALLSLSIYLLFAYIVLKQVSTMTKIISGNLNPYIKFISRLHFLLAALVLLLAFVVL